MSVKRQPFRRGTGSVGKALKLVTELAAAGSGGLRLTDLVGRTNMDTSTACRMLACLVDEEFVQKVDGKRYRLGRRIYELGLAAGQHFTEPSAAKTYLSKLVERIGTTAVLNVRSGAEAVYIERLDGPNEVKGISPVGSRLPIGVGSGGLALLAVMEPREAEALLCMNEHRYRAFGRHTSSILRSRLVEAQDVGYAKTVSFVRPDMGSLGVVVPQIGQIPKFAVSIVFDIGKVGPFEDLLSEVRAAASQVARALTLPDSRPQSSALS